QADSGLVRLRARLTSVPANGPVGAPEGAPGAGPDGTAGDVPFDLAEVLLTLPVPARATELLDFTGHQLRERAPQRAPVGHGTRLGAAHRGRPGVDAASLLAAGEAGFGDRRGRVWALHAATSGNPRLLAERRYHGRSVRGGGELLEPGEVRLAAGESYT